MAGSLAAICIHSYRFRMAFTLPFQVSHCILPGVIGFMKTPPPPAAFLGVHQHSDRIAGTSFCFHVLRQRFCTVTIGLSHNRFMHNQMSAPIKKRMKSSILSSISRTGYPCGLLTLAVFLCVFLCRFADEEPIRVDVEARRRAVHLLLGRLQQTQPSDLIVGSDEADHGTHGSHRTKPAKFNGKHEETRKRQNLP